MKRILLIVLALIFLLIVNLSPLWMEKLEYLSFPAFLFMVLVYIAFVISLILQIIKSIKEQYINRIRIITIGILFFVLTIIFLKPNGFVNLDKFGSNIIFVAEREGVANCKTILILKDDFSFKERNVCFGITEVTGAFNILNDTIFFDNINFGRDVNEYFRFGIIKPYKHYVDSTIFEFIRYKSKSDTVGHNLWITKNELNVLYE